MPILSKISRLAPTCWLVFQDLIAVLREEHNSSNTTRSHVLFLHCSSADMKSEGGDFVINET